MTEVGWLLAPKYSGGVDACLPIGIRNISSVTDESAVYYDLAKFMHCRNCVTCRQHRDLLPRAAKNEPAPAQQSSGVDACNCLEGCVDVALLLVFRRRISSPNALAVVSASALMGSVSGKFGSTK